MIIETHRLQIVKFEARYLTDTYIGWLNDKSLVRYSTQRLLNHTLESCEAYMRSFDNTPNYFWAILCKDRDHRHIGNMNAYIDPVNGVADLGILIGDPESSGQGYGREAWQAVCDHLLQAASIRKISAGTLAVNTPMLAIMRACKMVDDGTRKRHCLLEGEEVDVIHMALFARKDP
jgi:RimJ/RimL family protein N-acetyltransferase